jgi:flagellar biosynthesis regulator FlaF
LSDICICGALVSLKLGRQVKSAQEKLQGKLGEMLDSNTNNIQLNNDTVHQRSNEASSAVDGNASYDTPLPLVKPQSAPHSKPHNSIESVWFKSKVVSRSHAEIWLKDGQVRNEKRDALISL